MSPIQHAKFVSIFADIVLKVRQPMVNEVHQFKDGGTLISFLYPGQNKDLVDQLIAKKLTAFGKPVDLSVSGFITVFSKVNMYRAKCSGTAVSYCRALGLIPGKSVMHMWWTEVSMACLLLSGSVSTGWYTRPI